MKIIKLIPGLLLISTIVFIIPSCGDDEDEVFLPKPKGYPRIDFPEKSYRLFDSVCPYKFEIPTYAYIDNDRHKGADPCWINVNFPKYNAQIHLSYKSVTNNLDTFLNDSRDFAIKHQIKATGLDETIIIRDSAKVFGLVYDISGNTASNIQFYLTDSTRHFMRGALYFNVAPNIDSLKVVVDYIRKDIVHLIKTFNWKN
ncbi:MAG: gliding motility-associated lipoprotein GldD [Bacteroidota bacterium]|jgi:gliding motility-associated lipoprotein GldD|nr:gliding motility-associated lipoprotein GldD [Bacteroidota bacterium]